MTHFKHLKRASIALFLFLSACTTPCPQWILQKAVTNCPSYNSGKVTLAPDNTFCGLELEITRGACGLRMYINVFSLELMPEHPMQSCVVVKVTCGDREQSHNGFLYQGGQRVLLPGIARDSIIESLCQNEPVCIAVGRYRSEILPYDFAVKYQALLNLPMN